MKRVIKALTILFLFIGLNACSVQKTNPKWIQDPRVEVVNEQTVIFRDVIKIEIVSASPTQITYVYDLKHGRPVKTARSSFEVNVKRGDYLIQSNRKITKTQYEVVIE